MKYPLKNVFTVPSVRYENGNPENVILRFAQIGPYAALIVPLSRSDSSADSVSFVPPEIRDSVKSYIEEQEQALPQSSQRTTSEHAYAPPTYKNPSTPGSISPYTSHQPEVSNPTSEPPVGYTKSNGFVIRVSNPAGGDPNKPGYQEYQEFFVPSIRGQLVAENNEKIVANPFTYYAASVPRTSQFEEVYSKGNPPFSSLAAPSKSPASATDLTDLAASASSSNYDSGSLEAENDRQKDSDRRHYQSGWSLVETQDPQPVYPFEGPPPGQPEFSDVSPGSDLKNYQYQQPGLETYNKIQSPIFKESTDSESLDSTNSNRPLNSLTDTEEGLNSGTRAPKLENLSSSVKQDAKVPKLTAVETDSTHHQSDQTKDSIFKDSANSAQTFKAPSSNEQFQGTSRGIEGVVPKEEEIGQVDSAQQFGRFQGTPMPNSATTDRFRSTSVKSDASSSALPPALAPYSGEIDQNNKNDASKASDSINQFNRFQETSTSNFGQMKGATLDNNRQLGGFQSSTGQNLGRLNNEGSTPSSGSAQQFQGSSAQNFKQISADSIPSADALPSSQFNQFEEITGQNLGQEKAYLVPIDSVQQLERFLNQRGQISNAGQKDNTLSTIDVSRNHPLFINERLKAIRLFPAVFTTTGTEAKIELPLSASLIGRTQEKMVIPDTIIPLPSKGSLPIGYKEKEPLLNSEYYYRGTAIPVIIHRSSYDGLGNFENAVTDSSLNLNNQQGAAQLNTVGEFRPVSDFDPVSAAAAAAAAVAADSENFNRFDNRKA